MSTRRKSSLRVVPKVPASAVPEQRDRFKPDRSNMFVAPANIPRIKVEPKVSPFVADPFAHSNTPLAIRVMRVRGTELAKPDTHKPVGPTLLGKLIMGLLLIAAAAIWYEPVWRK